MTPSQRLNLIQRNNYCVNCLRSGHSSKACSSGTCSTCHKKHNTLLHLDGRQPAPRTSKITTASTIGHQSQQFNSSDPIPTTSQGSVSLAAVQKSPSRTTKVLLSTIWLSVTDKWGQSIQCRALLDSGSQANFISKRLVSRLGLQKGPCLVDIEGIGQAKGQVAERVNIKVMSNTSNFSKNIEAHILPKIVSEQPSWNIDISNWNIPKNIQLADPTFHKSQNIDMLIGAGTFFTALCVGQISLGQGSPVLQNSLFGWLVGGECESYASDKYKSTPNDAITCGICTEDESLNEKLEKFWKIEECDAHVNTLTAAERRCENFFVQNLRRHTDGRFIVKLPFQSNPGQLGESKIIAMQRFMAMERKLIRNPDLKTQYVEFMREYANLGHMTEVPLRDIVGEQYFVPHHAVLKPDSATTKLRVVFDASAKTSTNVSLNDILAKGPLIQDDVFTILMRFRLPRYAFTADVEKMYRQIWMSEEDRKFQLILWREEPTHPLKCYQLNTVTYGTSSAPFLAIRTLRELAEIEKHNFPLAAEAVNSNAYVDDVLSGSDQITTAVETQSQLRRMLSSAGLNLRKWCANHPRLLQNIMPEDQAVMLNFNESDNGNIKTMGLIWHPTADNFTIKVGKEQHGRITKRTALSDTAQLFDPLGFIAPVTVAAKIFLQQLWQLKLDWDAALPQNLHTTWTKFRAELQELEKINIPRHIFGQGSHQQLQVHIFADASERAYGAVAYARTIGPHDTVIVRFLCAKSRVAPLKQTTLPRLELCAAKLATELFQKLQDSSIFKGVNAFFWSDSTAVLGWINAESSNYHTFIANRVSAIQRITTPQQWRHVRSEDNPADLISRGLTPEKIVGNNFWFYGPKFLHGSLTCWPLQPPRGKCSLELRQKSPLVSASAVTAEANSFLQNVQHGNNFRRLQRIMAYVLRFIRRKQQKHDVCPSTLNVQGDEMDHALMFIVKLMQRETFTEDISLLQRHQAVKNDSSISSLTPFLDEDGVIRVGGRLEASNLSYDAKHPMLLPYRHAFTKILVETIHKENMHAGPQTVMSIVRQRFWPLRLKTVARSVVQNCILCTRARPKLLKQFMGNLPADRVQPARPFVISGVDFFGPVWTHFKIRGKRPLKAYVSVFCCFSTKAVHMELVNDLSTEAFVGALKRFMARRGHCKTLYCDNATNFVGAKNYMNELHQIIHSNKANKMIISECSKRGTVFSFIPPRAPHFGGLWEAAVKSAKQLLRSMLSAASLTYEEMETVIVEAEAIMNSRPITPMSSDPNDLQALTPGHLLIGEPLTSTTDPRAQINYAPFSTRWKIIAQLKDEFWRRWILEYLTTLQHRYKWKQESQNVKAGTMVLIKDENLPPLKWPLGRIVKVIRGEDGLIRVADVRTATNVSRRPIHKLAPLPIQDESNSDTANGQEITINDGSSPRPKRARVATASMLTTVLLACLILPLCLASSVEISPFASNLGIYFEKIGTAGMIASEWKLITYVDMQPYWRNFEAVSGYTKAIRSSCVTTNSSHCPSILNLIERFMNEMTSKNQLLHGPNISRRKRGALNLVGNIAHSLFGILDSEYANQAANTIDEIRQNEQHLAGHLRNQTSFLDSTINIMKVNQQQVEKELNGIEKFLHRQAQKETQQQVISELVLQATLEMLNLQRIQESLLDILIDIHHGTINPELISPQQLQAELLTVKAHLPTHLKMPTSSTELLTFYKLMSIESRLTAKYLIFQIKIPLLATDDFELLRLTSVPWQTRGKFIKIRSNFPYMLVNLHRDHYYPLKETELGNCIVIKADSYICHQTHPLYLKGAKIGACELQLLNQNSSNGSCEIESAESGPHWIQLANPNYWLYSVEGEYLINAVCGNNLKQVQVKLAGILKMSENCIIKQPLITIQGFQLLETTNHKAYIPTVNISGVIAMPKDNDDFWNTTTRRHSTVEELNNLQRHLSKFPSDFPNHLTSHDVHHYSVSYICLFIIMGLIASYVWRRRNKKTKPSENQDETDNNAVPQHEVEVITVYG